MIRPVLHLALFAVLAKLWSLREEKQKWQTWMGIFFLFLAAMATSVHPSVVLYLVVFLAVTVVLMVRFVYLHVLASFGHRDLEPPTPAGARLPGGRRRGDAAARGAALRRPAAGAIAVHHGAGRGRRAAGVTGGVLRRHEPRPHRPDPGQPADRHAALVLRPAGAARSDAVQGGDLRPLGGSDLAPQRSQPHAPAQPPRRALPARRGRPRRFGADRPRAVAVDQPDPPDGDVGGRSRSRGARPRPRRRDLPQGDAGGGARLQGGPGGDGAFARRPGGGVGGRRGHRRSRRRCLGCRRSRRSPGGSRSGARPVRRHAADRRARRGVGGGRHADGAGPPDRAPPARRLRLYAGVHRPGRRAADRVLPARSTARTLRVLRLRDGAAAAVAGNPGAPGHRLPRRRVRTVGARLGGPAVECARLGRGLHPGDRLADLRSDAAGRAADERPREPPGFDARGLGVRGLPLGPLRDLVRFLRPGRDLLPPAFALGSVHARALPVDARAARDRRRSGFGRGPGRRAGDRGARDSAVLARPARRMGRRRAARRARRSRLPSAQARGVERHARLSRPARHARRHRPGARSPGWARSPSPTSRGAACRRRRRRPAAWSRATSARASPARGSRTRRWRCCAPTSPRSTGPPARRSPRGGARSAAASIGPPGPPGTTADRRAPEMWNTSQAPGTRRETR